MLDHLNKKVAILQILLLVKLVLAQDNLLALSNCLGNCAICSNDQPSTCSGLEYVQCVKGYQGNSCQAKQTYFNQIILKDSTTEAVGYDLWKMQNTTKCVYKNSKNQDKNVFVLGIYNQFNYNEVQIQIQPYYQNYIISFNLIRGSWTPYSDLLHFKLLDQDDQILFESFIQFSRREDINPKKHLLRCKNQAMIMEKYQIEGKIQSKKHRKFVLKFQGMMFSADGKWGLTNIKALFGCSKFLKYGEEGCQTCTQGYYHVLSPLGDVIGCETCPINCKTCSNPNQCLSCIEGFNLNGKKCQNKHILSKFPANSKSLICHTSNYQLSTNILGNQTLTLMSQNLPLHKRIRLIFYLAIQLENINITNIKDIISIFIDGVKIKDISKNQIDALQNKAECKGFGKNGYYALIKIQSSYLAHEKNKIEVNIKRSSNRKIGLQQVYFQYEKKDQQPKQETKNNNLTENKAKQNQQPSSQPKIPQSQKSNYKIPKPSNFSSQPEKSNETIKKIEPFNIQNATNKTIQITKPKQQIKDIYKPNITEEPKTKKQEAKKQQIKTIIESIIEKQNNIEPPLIKPLFNKKQQVQPQKKSIPQIIKNQPQKYLIIEPKKTLDYKNSQAKKDQQILTNSSIYKQNEQSKKPTFQTPPTQQTIPIHAKPTNKHIPSTIQSLFSLNNQIFQSMNKLSQNKWKTKFSLKPGKQLIIIITLPVQIQHYPFFMAHFLNENISIVPTIKQINSQMHQLKFDIKKSLLDQIVQIYMSDQPKTSIKNRYLQQKTSQVLSLGVTSIRRYDYLHEQQWKQILKYSKLFEIFAWFAIISTIVLSFLGISVLTQKFSILLQIIFLHIFIYTEYLPINFKYTIKGLQRMINLNYFSKDTSQSIQKFLLGNLMQVSPLKFTQFRTDINFTRAIYPCIIINFFYFIWFIILKFLINKRIPLLPKSQKLKLFFTNLCQRSLSFWYQIWQYQFLVFIWSAIVQFYNIYYPTNFTHSYIPNILFCIFCFIITFTFPILTFLYIHKKYYLIKYSQYIYCYRYIFYLNLTKQQLPSCSHRIYLIIRNFRYLLLIIALICLGHLPVPAIIVIIIIHILSIVYIKLTDIKIYKIDQILCILEHISLIAYVIGILIAFETSTYLQTKHYIFIGHVLCGICLFVIFVGLCRVGYYFYHQYMVKQINNQEEKVSMEIKYEEQVHIS